MNRIIFTLFALCALTMFSADIFAETKTPTHFTQRIETPKNKIIQNLANNEDSQLVSNRNKNKNRYERMQARKRNNGSTNTTETRTEAENISNTNNRQKRKTGRELRAERAKVNDAVKDILND